MALRAVNLARSMNELSEFFPAPIGIKWAMARGYLINRSISYWVGVQPGIYGHPSNPLTIDDKTADRIPEKVKPLRKDNWQLIARFC